MPSDQASFRSRQEDRGSDATTRRPGGDRNRILVVDDDPAMCELLARLLSDSGYEVRSAASGDRAIGLARQHPPDLLLLDVAMPGRDGFDVLDALKRDRRTRSIPVVFLSARRGTVERVRGLRSGAVDYIVKPFDRAEVVARVARHLEVARRERSLSASHRDLAERHGSLRADLEAAGRVQRRFVHVHADDTGKYAVAARFLPYVGIGGDLLGVFPLSSRWMALFVLDVSGHGVSSALVAASISSLFRPGSLYLADPRMQDGSPQQPARILARMARDYPVERTGHVLTMVYGLLERETGRFRYASAGHPPPLHLRGDGTVARLEVGGPLLGAIPDARFEEGEVFLGAGDRLVLYTDGVLDARDCDGNPFTADHLQRNLCTHAALPIDAQLGQLAGALKRHLGGLDAQDDVSLLGLERRRDPVRRCDALELLPPCPAPPRRGVSSVEDSGCFVVIDADLEQVVKLRASTRAVCRAAGLGEEEAEAVALAVGEAVTNVIVHGYSGARGEIISLTARAKAERIEIRIRDRARPAPAHVFSTRTRADLPDGPLDPSGRGLEVIRSVMDRIRYCTDENHTNELILERWLPAPATGEETRHEAHDRTP